MRFDDDVMPVAKQQTISLSKGKAVNLSKTFKVNHAMVGLGWRRSASVLEAFDLDASVFGLGANGKSNTDWMIFYGHTASPEIQRGRCAIVHQGDNLEGTEDGIGDAEQIFIDLTDLPSYIKRVAVVITIYQSGMKNQTFGQVDTAFVRVCDRDTDAELVRYTLNKDYGNSAAVIAAEFRRMPGDEWEFVAVGQPVAGGMPEVCGMFGIAVAGEG